jgi:sugar-specific transcriptional regulator TrmB
MSTMVECLGEIGFTEYEAKAYVALVRLGPASGYQIAKESGVPRSTIYEILAKLVVRGAALTQSFAEQVRYAPVPPEQFLGRIRYELEGNLDTLAHGLKGMAESAAPPGNTWNLAGRKNLFSYARQMIEGAKKEIALLVGDDDELDQLLPQLQQAQARGIALLVICPTPYNAEDVPLVVHPQGLRLRQTLGHGFTLIVDGREALTGEVDRSQSAVWTTNGYAVACALWCLKQEMAGEKGKNQR